MSIFINPQEINSLPKTPSKENNQSNKEFSLIELNKDILVNHHNLLLEHKKEIFNKVKDYTIYIMIMFSTLMGITIICILLGAVTFKEIFNFIKDCPYFLVFLIALLLIPVWCMTSLIKGIFKISGNEEANLLEKMINFGKDNMN